jgi:hypothetical protein
MLNIPARTKSLPDRAAYAKMVAWAEKRYAPDIPWERLPLLRAGQRGRPKKGAEHLGLKPRTVKMPEMVWKALADAAHREGVSVNALLSAIGNDLLRRRLLEKEIRRLVKAGLLKSSLPPGSAERWRPSRLG